MALVPPYCVKLLSFFPLLFACESLPCPVSEAGSVCVWLVLARSCSNFGRLATALARCKMILSPVFAARALFFGRLFWRLNCFFANTNRLFKVMSKTRLSDIWARQGKGRVGKDLSNAIANDAFVDNENIHRQKVNGSS